MKPGLAAATLGLALLAALSAEAGERRLVPVDIVDMKPVFGQVQARHTVLARARIGGTLVELSVTEGNQVEEGEVIGRIVDDRIDFEVMAVEAQLSGLKASLANARAERDRASQLLKSGATTAQRLDELQTKVDVADTAVVAAEANRAVLLEQAAQGAVHAPAAGTILSVPATRSGVVMAGETIATIGGGGFFLRLAIPERHATALAEGAPIRIEAAGKSLAGTLAKIYPEISGGRVTADVEVPGLDTRFVGARLPVELAVGQRRALLVPAGAVTSRAGIDFVSVREDGGIVERAVITGTTPREDGEIEILTGLAEGDWIIFP